MIIQRCEEYIVHTVAYFLACILGTLMLIKFCHIGLGVSTFVMLPIYWITFSSTIAKGRTFIIEEDGCTVCFWKYCRKYKWKDLKTKVITEYSSPAILSARGDCPYRKDVIFAPYFIHKPKFIRADVYSWIHPFTCIYVQFDPKVKGDFRRHYEVEEKVFLSKMEQWGVELTNKTGDGSLS